MEKVKRVITFVRSSTDKQEIESQTYENFQYLKKLGYEEDEIITIGTSGASAIKLDDKYMENINKFYDTLEITPTIELVFGWAIDRIGRHSELLMQFKNTLIAKKIQLKIKEPSLTLLNDDGSVNDGVELAFSLFATMAEQEMRMKNARFKRAKKRNKRENRFNGGRIKYGYKVDENGYIKEDEDEAGLLRMIINEYITTNISQLNLFQEYKLRGYNFSYQTFRKFFEGDYYGCGKNNYPPIFNNETFEKVKAKIESNKTTVDKGKRNYYIGAKLIVCPCCGRHLLANKGSGTYMCKQSTKQENYKCEFKSQVNINAIDSVAWYCGMMAQIYYIANSHQAEKEKITIQIINEKRKLSTYLELEQTHKNKIDDIYSRYMLNKITKKQMENYTALAEQAMENNKRDIASTRTTLTHLEETANAMENNINIIYKMGATFESEYLSDKWEYKEMYEIAHQHIKQIKYNDVNVVLPNGKEITGKEIKVYFYNENLKTKTFIYNPNAKSNMLLKIMEVKHGKIVSSDVKWLERINRNKAMKARKNK